MRLSKDNMVSIRAVVRIARLKWFRKSALLLVI